MGIRDSEITEATWQHVTIKSKMRGISIMGSKFRVTAKGPDLNGVVMIVNRTQCSQGQPIRVCLIN